MIAIHRFRRAVVARLAADDGFTLAELLVVIAISSTIVLVLGSAFTAAARTSVDANTRLRESHDAQILNTYFVPDAGGISSLSLTAPACASTVPAGSSPVASFAWLDASNVPKSAYYYTTAPVSGVAQLQRRFCDNGVARPTDVILGRQITKVTMTCDPACSGVPTSVALTILESSGFTYTAQVSPRAALPTTTYAAAPVVRSIKRVGSTPTNAGQVQYSVTFSEAVTGVNIGSNSDFFLNPTVTGASIAQLIGVGGGTTYTVVVNTGTATAGSVGLDLSNDGTIKDRSSQALSGNLNGETYTIDKIAPGAPALTLAGVSPTSAAAVSWTVTFPEAVTGVAVNDFVLARTGTVAGGAVTAVTGSGTTWTVTGSTGTGAGTLGLNLVDDDSIADLAANPLGGPGTGNGNATGALYTIDRTAPTVVSVNRAGSTPTNAGTLSWTATFSEPVVGVNSADFALVRAAGVTGGSITGVTGSGTTWTVTAGTGAGDGTLGLNLTDDDSITDVAGNPLGGSGAGNGNFTGQAYALDRTGPTVSSITRAGTSPSSASSVSWTVTFSESVSGVSVGDFTLARSGRVTGGSVTAVTGSGTIWTVTAGTGAGNGTLGLNLIDRDTITDSVGNFLGGTGLGNGNFTGQTYTLDRGPSVIGLSLINKGASAGTMEQGDQIVITFSDPVAANTVCDKWANDSADHDLNADNDVTVLVTNKGGAGSFDGITFTSTACPNLNLGSVDLGATGYVSTNRTFKGSGTGKSTIHWDAANAVLTVTLGTPSGATSKVTSSAAVYTVDPALTGTNGKAVSSTPYTTGSIAQF